MIKGYLDGKAFIPDLLVAYKDFKPRSKGPVVVLGVTKGAIHAMGKNVVKIFLEANGFRVIDLGYCVEPVMFANAAKKHKAKFVGISIPVTTAGAFIKKAISLVRKKAPKARIIIGGCAINEEWAPLVGADYYAEGAEQCVKLLKRLSK